MDPDPVGSASFCRIRIGIRTAFPNPVPEPYTTFCDINLQIFCKYIFTLRLTITYIFQSLAAVILCALKNLSIINKVKFLGKIRINIKTLLIHNTGNAVLIPIQHDCVYTSVPDPDS
jgi:hypothetical protein